MRTAPPVKIPDDVHVAIFGELPYVLDVVRVESRLGAKQARIPIKRPAHVADRDTSEDAYSHLGVASLRSDELSNSSR